MRLVQNLPENFSGGVLSHSGARLSNTPGKVLHLDNETRDDHAAAFPALRSVGVKREAGATSAQQFDAGYTVDVNIRAGHRFEGAVAGDVERHSIPRCVTGESYGTLRQDYKRVSLTFFARFLFAYSNEIARNLAHKSKQFASTLFPVSFRADLTSGGSEARVSGIRHGIGPARFFPRVHITHRRSSRFGRATADAIRSVRLSFPVHLKKNPPRALRDWFPAVRRGARSLSHDSNNVIGGLSGVQKDFAIGATHV